MKIKYLFLNHFDTYEELVSADEQFIHYYNHQRRQHTVCTQLGLLVRPDLTDTVVTLRKSLRMGGLGGVLVKVGLGVASSLCLDSLPHISGALILGQHGSGGFNDRCSGLEGLQQFAIALGQLLPDVVQLQGKVADGLPLRLGQLQQPLLPAPIRPLSQTVTGRVPYEVIVGAIVHRSGLGGVGIAQLLLAGVLEVGGLQAGLGEEVTHQTGGTVGIAQLAEEELPDGGLGIFGGSRNSGFLLTLQQSFYIGTEGVHAHVTVSSEVEKYDEQYFCSSCRELLAEYKGNGYVLADLRNLDTPTIYPVKAGTKFEVRCYTVSVTETKEKELDITVLGSIPTDG